MDAGGDHGSAAKGLAIDLEIAGSGPVSCRFFIPSSFFTMCSSLACLSFVTTVCRPSPLAADIAIVNTSVYSDWSVLFSRYTHTDTHTCTHMHACTDTHTHNVHVRTHTCTCKEACTRMLALEQLTARVINT